MRFLHSQRRARQSGFNLIELGIALAVVGLVGAGIWVAASGAQDARRTNETVDQVRLIIENIRDSYATSAQLPNLDFNRFTQTVGGRPAVGGRDLFPAETRLSATAFVNPWSSDGTGSICTGGTICVSANNVFGGLVAQSSIILMLRRLPGNACINVTARLLNIAPEIGLVTIGTDPADNPVPTNVSAANATNIAWLTANCDTANPNNLYLGFRLAP